jgi:hypothetical protein
MPGRGRVIGDPRNAPATFQELAEPALVIAVLDPLDGCQRLPDVAEPLVYRAQGQAGLEVELLVLEPADAAA